MPFDKYFFSQFKEEIQEEKEKFKAHGEAKDIPTSGCDHKGKVKAIPGGLRCSSCNSGWSGQNLDILEKLLNPRN